MTIHAGVRFIVDLEFERLLDTTASGLCSQGFDSLFPRIEFIFVATAEEYLFNHEVRAIVIVVEHPVGDVVDVAAFYLIFDRVVDVEAGDFHRGELEFAL